MTDIRQLAFEALRQWYQSEQYIQYILPEYRQRLAGSDSRTFETLVHGTLMFRQQLDTILRLFISRTSSLPLSAHILLQLGAYEILHQRGNSDFGVVHSIVEISKRRAKHQSGLINAVLRKVITWQAGGNFKTFLADPAIPLAHRTSFPDWLVQRWEKQYPEDTEALLNALNSDPLRMIQILDDYEWQNIIHWLKAENLFLEINALDKHFVHVKRLAPILHHDYFERGLITIQDVSTTFPVKLLAGESLTQGVTDVCAAPGGKTLYLRQTAPHIRITACDLSDLRLDVLPKNLERLNLNRVDILQADARSADYPTSDFFLVDVPCSGFGVIRKRSDLRWRRKESEIHDLVALQSEILKNIARQVISGGGFVYSTCTIDSEENYGVIARFLLDHPEFYIDKSPKPDIPDTLRDRSGAVVTFPHRHPAEGSFAVLLKRY